MKVTPEKKAAFCAALASSGGNVTRACEAIEIARLTAYRWREEDADFAAEWDRAKAIGLDALEDEATRRAFEGVDKAVTYQGVITDTVTEYSDTLAIFLLKGGKPDKYRENARMELTGPDGGAIQFTDTQRAARISAILAAAESRRRSEVSDAPAGEGNVDDLA